MFYYSLIGSSVRIFNARPSEALKGCPEALSSCHEITDPEALRALVQNLAPGKSLTMPLEAFYSKNWRKLIK